MVDKDNDSCREFFKQLNVLPLSAQNIYSLLMFVVNNKNLFMDNAGLYSIKTRKSYNFHFPSPHLTVFQKGVYYADIKVFNYLPHIYKEYSK